jgi:cell fate regulator YaaT (PSP1 superfamily)
MFDVYGISFEGKDRIYYFSPNHLDIKKNDEVIVETERGLQFGYVKTDLMTINETKLHGPLKYVVRIANKEDLKKHQTNNEDAKEAAKTCRNMVEDMHIDMKIIDAEYMFDRSQLMFHFLSDNRVDFRALAKELASIYKTRIELRQVGVRDKAKNVGGIGPCGRCLCCSKFLNDFDSVSINMAKNQNLSLNPTKVNGLCGRLLCCLKYEDDCYLECHKYVPNIGSKYKTDKGEGTVVSVDVLQRKFRVDVPEVGIVEVTKE